LNFALASSLSLSLPYVKKSGKLFLGIFGRLVFAIVSSFVENI
jgi:hypothetical protein